MSNRKSNARSRVQRARQWRPTPDSLAAAAVAASGDPTVPLALDAYELNEPEQDSEGRTRLGHVAPERTGTSACRATSHGTKDGAYSRLQELRRWSAHGPPDEYRR
jgi:hypothetical protein